MMPYPIARSDAVLKLHRKLSRYSTPIACLAGMAVSCLALALAWLALLQNVLQDASRAQDKTNALIATVGTQSRALQSRLLADFKPECTPQNLAALNSLLFEYRFHKDIGLYNAEGKIFCTAAMGLLPEPVADTPTPYITKLGGPIWFNELSPVSRGRLRTTIMSGKPFQLISDPGVMAEILSQADVFWFGSIDMPTHIGATVTPALQAPILALGRAQEKGWKILWHEGVAVSVVQAEGTLARFANFRYLSDSYTTQPLLAELLLVFSGLLGVVTAVFLQPRLQRLGRLPHRLQRLIEAQYVLCMYQPIVELATGKPVGCEVLMRLQDDGAMIYPEAMIKAAYERKLTWELDRAVLSRAMHELAPVLPHLRGLKVAFNLFPESISFAPIDALIRPYLARFSVHDVHIGIELTEYHFAESLIPEVRRFEQAGYEVSVDDFGTGYSNLNAVKKVAPHTLKIDKSFVYEMEDASVRSSLIPEIVAIAGAVGATVVAEGIENAEQAERLQDMAVRYGQGNHFAAPMPLADFVAYVAAYAEAFVADADGKFAAAEAFASPAQIG